MKISMSTDSRQRSRLNAQADGRWDGSPVMTSAVLGLRADLVDVNRIAVAGSLLFGEYIGGILSFEGPINIVTANAIQRYLAPIHVYPTQIDEGPKPIVSGSDTLMVRIFDSPYDAAPSFDGVSLNLLDSTSFSGSLRSLKSVFTEANYITFCGDDDEAIDRFKVAMGVLVSADLNIGIVEIDSPMRRRSYARIRDLLASVGLGFRVNE